MKTLVVVCTIAVTLCCSVAQAYMPSPSSPYTVTFDDVPSGSDLSYYEAEHGLVAYNGWSVIDYIAAGWPSSHSGTNVAAWDGNLLYSAGFQFGRDPMDYPDTEFLPYTVRSVAAYVSTETGAVLQMIGYSHEGIAVASELVGNLGEAWDNRYVEILSTAGDISYVKFLGVNSPEDKRRFCIDNLTIVPVPEPSSLAALGIGLGGLLLRRRGRS